MPIDSHLSYLSKHRYLPRQLASPPHPALAMVVVIPAYAETQLFESLDSLAQCDSPSGKVEVLVVLNHGEDAPEEAKRLNEKCHQELLSKGEKFSKWFDLYVIFAADLKKKFAGVGLARKIGMDEAIDRFEQANQEDGIVLCMDADSKVAPNYFLEVEKFFKQNRKMWACSIYYEHPLSGDEFPQEIYEAILQYELHLRYYIEALRMAGHPHAYHTIGSSMAVRGSAYQKMGGMNRRKAGEDFYFLQKFIQIERLGELSSTTVFPSPRPSLRVPFGTGRAIHQHLDSGRLTWLTFDLAVFDELKKLIDHVPNWYLSDDLPSVNIAMQNFLIEQGLLDQIREIRSHVASKNSFVQRFFKWFDALKVLRMLHHLEKKGFPQISLYKVAHTLQQKSTAEFSGENARELLAWYRKLQRENTEK